MTSARPRAMPPAFRSVIRQARQAICYLNSTLILNLRQAYYMGVFSILFITVLLLLYR